MLNSSLQNKGDIIYVAISYKDESGKYKVKWVSTQLKVGTGKRRIEEKRKEIVAAFEDELNRKKYSPLCCTSTPAIRCSFSEFMDMWLERNKFDLAPSTYDGYAKNIRKIKAYFKEDIMLDKLTRTQIKDFYDDMRRSGLSNNSVKHLHANIHKALKDAVDRELISSNPAEDITFPKIDKYEAVFYNKDELLNLFKVFEGDRMELVVQLAAYYGFRRSEVVGLKWDAIDFEKKTIAIRRKITNSFGGGEKLIESSTLKTESSRRTLPLIPHIEELLREEQERQKYYKKLLREGYCSDYEGYICRDNLGKLITPNYVSDHFRHMIKNNKLKKLRFHDLRHSCASLLLANGIQMKEIQDWLGHSSYNVTANLYSHLEYTAKIASADTIAAVLG